MDESKKKSVVISFRIDIEDYQPIEEILKKNQILTKSEFMRCLFLKNSEEVIKSISNKKSSFDKKGLFLLANMSNNLNQIAKKINTDVKKGTISEITYQKAINKMVSIENLLEEIANAI